MGYEFSIPIIPLGLVAQSMRSVPKKHGNGFQLVDCSEAVNFLN